MDRDDIDVFQDGDVKEKEIFVDYSNAPKPANMVSKKTATVSIIATVVVLLIIGASFTAGFFTARSTGIEGDMPLLEKAYEIVRDYYYEDITFSEFQEMASAYMVSALDDYSGVTYATQPAGEDTFGFNDKVTIYNEHIVSKIIQATPISSAVAVKKCINPVYSQGSNYKYVEYTEVDAEDNIKVDVGDKFVAFSYNGLKPFLVENMTKDEVSSLLSSAGTKTFTLYFAKSNGEGRFADDFVYKFVVERKYVETKHAFLYTPEEIGDPTGTTAMILFDSFSGTAVADFTACCQEFVEHSEYKHLILDLRDNGGGDQEILAYIGACLLKGADKEDLPIIKTYYNAGKGKFKTEYVTSSKTGNVEVDDEVTSYNAVNLPSLVEDFKLTILCNGHSASSSEALIGALMYYNNAEIVGQKTYGKGIGQRVFPFTEKYYLVVTNAKYFVPTDENGDGVAEWTKSIHNVGFIPTEENTIDAICRPMSTDKAIKRALTILNG